MTIATYTASTPSDFGEIIFGFVLGFSLVANVCWPQLIRFF